MGRKGIQLTVTGSLSSHNDERDDQDRELWERFAREVRDLAGRPEYDAIDLDVSE
jgi:hypothetical protein